MLSANPSDQLSQGAGITADLPAAPGARSTLERLVNEAVNVPEILEQACVHSRVESSHCRACVDACPRGAWVLDVDCLGIDTAACDGCGLCVPACPEGALHTERELCIGETTKGHKIAMLACEYSDCGDAGRGIACIHAMGLDDLLTLTHRGIRRLGLCTAECSACERHSEAGFDAHLAAANGLLADRHARPISVRRFSAPEWSALKAKMVDAHPLSNPVSRRSWIRGLATGESQPRIRRMALGEWNFPRTPPGTLLPKVADARLPWVPRLDPLRCNGCMACIKLCPHQAIVMEAAEGKSHPLLHIRAENCTGCRICVDSCETDALDIAALVTPDTGLIPMEQGQCRACGVDFLVPRGSQKAGQGMCSICATTNHHSKLFQVQD